MSTSKSKEGNKGGERPVRKSEALNLGKIDYRNIILSREKEIVHCKPCSPTSFCMYDGA